MARVAQSAAVEAIYSAALTTSGWTDMLERVADHIGATAGLLTRQEFVGDGSFFIGARLLEDVVQVYLDRYQLNPYSLAITRRPAGRPVVTCELAPDDEVRRTEFYADIIAPHRIACQFMLPLAAMHGAGGSGGVSFSISLGGMDEAQAVLRRLERLSSHLSRGVELSLTLLRSKRESGLARGLLEVLSSPALLLDKLGRILRLNAEAEALLVLADGLGFAPREKRLHASLPDEERRLARFLRLALDSAEGQDTAWQEALRVARPSGRASYILVVTPLPLAGTSPLMDLLEQPARLLLQIIEPEPKARDVRLLRSAYGLTPAEARVAAAIGSGLSLPQAARTLGVSVNTVHTHLARIFDKTGLRSQVALAQMLAALPRG